jgi:hypothetical protein
MTGSVLNLYEMLIQGQESRNTQNGQPYPSFMLIKSSLGVVIFWWQCIRMESWQRCWRRRRCWFLLRGKLQSRVMCCNNVQQVFETKHSDESVR